MGGAGPHAPGVRQERAVAADPVPIAVSRVVTVAVVHDVVLSPLSAQYDTTQSPAAVVMAGVRCCVAVRSEDERATTGTASLTPE